MKVAIVHEYLNQYGGAEKNLESILELFPDAPIYTALYKPEKMSDVINARQIICPKNSLLMKFPKYFTFLMPFIFESFDLTGYDLIISDGTAWPKGILTTPDQVHISYIHTPPRFLYGYSVESTIRNAWYLKPIISVIDFFLRIWDSAAAQRPDFIITNSRETQKRIQKFYKRAAKVIYPPVKVTFDGISLDGKPEFTDTPYYLLLGRLVAYKNFDLVIKAFNILGLPLIVVGGGLEFERLKALADTNIKFTDKVSEELKHQYLEHCLALINPVVDEDFGITPVEAMAHGKPVFAHKSGGHLETIEEGVSGMFFESTQLEDFINKFREFDLAVAANKFNSQKIKENVQKFNEDRFKQEFQDFVSACLKDYNA